MTTVAPGVVPVFAMPFASLQLVVPDGLNADLLRLLESRSTTAFRDPSVPPSAFTFVSRDDFLEWPDAAVQRLRAELLAGVCAVVGAVNRYSDEEFEALSMQSRGWFSLVRPNGGIPAVTHPMYTWCAVYCVAAPSRGSGRFDSGVLRLYELRLRTAYVDASTTSLRPPFEHGHHLWQPRAGWLAVFPAAHPHEIAINREDGVIALVTATVRFAHPAPRDAGSS